MTQIVLYHYLDKLYLSVSRHPVALHTRINNNFLNTNRTRTLQIRNVFKRLIAIFFYKINTIRITIGIDGNNTFTQLFTINMDFQSRSDNRTNENQLNLRYYLFLIHKLPYFIVRKRLQVVETTILYPRLYNLIMQIEHLTQTRHCDGNVFQYSSYYFLFHLRRVGELKFFFLLIRVPRCQNCLLFS